MAKKEKTDLERFNEFVDWFHELIWGTPRRSKKDKDDIGQYIGLNRDKPKRARGKKGRYKADDKSTPDINEAWVGGKAPKKRKK
tara:strand:- start:453 stop:704 length:252 start_codon:yes stop_codon:yes gene_type:complete